jgi:hypothetical protein
MVLAIGNCGIYGEHFGVRMKDTISITEGRPAYLTSYPKVAGGQR